MKRPPSKTSLKHLLMLLESDKKRYAGKWKKAKGFWTTAAYRVRVARKRAAFPLKVLLLPCDIALAMLKHQLTDAELPSTATIGPGFYLPHPQGVIVAQNVRISHHVSIFQQVTLGNWNDGWPSVRARASIFAGAKIIGKVIIGRSSYVGANAVVSKDVPEWHVASGVPATVKPRKVAEASVPTQSGVT